MDNQGPAIPTKPGSSVNPIDGSVPAADLLKPTSTGTILSSAQHDRAMGGYSGVRTPSADHTPKK